MKRLFRAIGHTVRYKLLALTLFPILLVMPVALLAALYWGSNFSYQQLFMKVTTDLSVASDVFRRIRRDYLGELARLGESYAFRKALEQGHLEALRTQLHEARRASGFSYLNLNVINLVPNSLFCLKISSIHHHLKESDMSLVPAVPTTDQAVFQKII